MTRPTGAALRELGQLIHRATSDLLSVGLDPDEAAPVDALAVDRHYSHPEPEQPQLRIDIRCPGCRFGTGVTTRDQYAILEELHTVACNVDHLAIELGSIDDILALPPHPDGAWDAGWSESRTG